jgi:hypothetical protein
MDLWVRAPALMCESLFSRTEIRLVGERAFGDIASRAVEGWTLFIDDVTALQLPGFRMYPSGRTHSCC